MHEVRIKGGKKQERHLCERCAREMGVSPVSPAGAQPFAQLLTQIIATPAGGASPGGKSASEAKSPQTTACNCCGMAYSQFRSSGLLGCAECYRAFEGLLGPLLARAHEGGTHHVGRQPLRFRESGASGASEQAAAADRPTRIAAVEQESTERLARIATLRRQLAEAVAAEQYERAAKIRDELSASEMRVVGPAGRAGDEVGPSRGQGPQPAAGDQT